MFLKNKNIIIKIRRSKVTDYAALKDRLIATVLLITHNLCFGLEIRQLVTWYAIITKGLKHAIVL